MKKKLQFPMSFLAFIVTMTLSAQENNIFRVQFSIVDATCYNNGKVVYALVDSAGMVLDSLPPGLSQVRAYYKMSELDSVHYAGWYYSGGTDTLTVNYGNYIVGLEALFEENPGDYVRVDTQALLTIATSYQKPTAAVVSKVPRFSRRASGTLYTVPCANVGRVQLRILYGQFPYTVTVMNTVGDTLRTEVFDGRQYGGTNESNYDYKDYYSIDSLAGGLWTFHVEDGCGYGLPDVSERVETWPLPNPQNLYISASTGNFSDSNVVQLMISFNENISGLMEQIHQYGRYRFRYAGLNEGEWHQMPYDTTVVGITMTLFDTVTTAGKYCDIWGRNIMFQYALDGCGTSNFSRTFQILKPNEIYFCKDSTNVTDSIRMSSENCIRDVAWHQEKYAIRYHKDGALTQYEPYYQSRNVEDDFYRYHYTHPLTWVYTDLRNGIVVKRDTVPIITDYSSLTELEARSFYGVPTDSALVIPIERKLLDGKGCELYVTVDTFRYIRDVTREMVCWQIDFQDDGGKCCSTPRWVKVFRVSDFGAKPDGTVIRLVRSPFNNRYNFEAVYHAADKTWTVVKDSVGNTAAITGQSDGLALYISDYCLPSGPYEFEVTTLCGTSSVAKKVAFNDHQQMQLSEEIEYVTSRNCGNLSIRYPKGAYQWVITNTSYDTGLPTDTVIQEVAMKATVVAAPNASLTGQVSIAPPHFTFSMPGTYVLRLCPNLEVDACSSFECRYDTFHLDAATVEFIEALALVCDTSSTEGNVWVRAGHGMPPYIYTLYDQPDKQGNILAVNNSGVFPNVPMRSGETISCLVQDSCNAYFHVNIQPNTMANLQKLWFDGGLSATTACEGSTIQIHALAIGDIWQYEWSGPDSFTSTSADPYVYIPRGGGDGWYKVTIRQTGCAGALCDSIYLTTLPAPSLTLSPDTTVCPGEVVKVRFTPHSDAGLGDIHFSMAFANASGVCVRNYSAASGVTVTDTFSTLSIAKIYPITIKDGQCEYPFADAGDTTYIRLRSDVSEACDIITAFDTVCFGGDARLAAVATDTLPYILRWFGDYNQKKLLKTDTMTGTDQWSYYDTAGIYRPTMLYVSLQHEGMCSSVNGLIDSVMNMCNGETTIACGRHVRFCDPGGPDAGSNVDGSFVHHFRTSDGTRVSLHIDEADLTGSAHLLVFSGEEIRVDSLLLNISKGSGIPQTVVSSGNVLTVCFTGNKTMRSDWSAVVEAAPGIAVADVWNSNAVWFEDEVCQSQSGVYADPYGMVPDIVSAEEVARAVRKAGNYFYTRTFPAGDSHGCDSTVNFTLVVNPPEVTETMATVVRDTGYLWHDSLYREGGSHAVLFTSAGGCDRLDVLTLKVIDASCPKADVCHGDTVTLTVTASLSKSLTHDTLQPRKVWPGDVLCTDGSILPVDSYLESGKPAKGVVFFVDETGFHGRAVALVEVQRMALRAVPPLVLIKPHTYDSTAIRDRDGEANTLHLKALETAYSGDDFISDATAVSYCYYFNHNTLAPDGDWHGWYLPSYGELSLMQGNVWEVKRTMNRICQQNSAYKPFSSYYYWSSTVRDGTQLWRISFVGWDPENCRKVFGVRPVTKF